MVLKYIRKLLGRVRQVAEALPPLPPLPEAPAAAAGPRIVHRPIPRHLIDPDVVKIIHRLTRFGHTAYLVGGGVRDLLLHRTPKDFDIATSAQPHDVKKLFRNCRIIGRRFRLAHIFFRDKIIEVATFRANIPGEEGGAEDADILIRSDNVFGNPETDALRRDFTINALFYDVDAGNVIDYVAGIPDLDAGILRTIGDPDIRMREDPIRILRALRLAGRLGFTIEAATLRAIRTHREEIRKAAVPRILEDILRMLRGSGAEKAFRGMLETGILETVLPELHASLAGPKHAEQTTAAFWKALHAVDLATARGTEFSNPTLMAALLYPRVAAVLNAPSGSDHDDGSEGGGGAMARALDAGLSPIETRLNIPRRDRDRMRQIYVAQKRLAGVRRGRRFSVASFLSRPFFPEAFDLFEILCSATGQHRDELRRWRERIAALAEEHGGLPPAAEEEPRRREGERPRHDRGERGGEGRRGRRRGRGRGGPDRQGEPVAAGGPGGGSPFAEAPERPDLSEEDVALIYGTVAVPIAPPPGGNRPRDGAAPGGSASDRPRDDRPQADRPQGDHSRPRRRRRGGRRHRRAGSGPGPTGGSATPDGGGGSSSGDTGPAGRSGAAGPPDNGAGETD